VTDRDAPRAAPLRGVRLAAAVLWVVAAVGLYLAVRELGLAVLP